MITDNSLDNPIVGLSVRLSIITNLTLVVFCKNNTEYTHGMSCPVGLNRRVQRVNHISPLDSR